MKKFISGLIIAIVVILAAAVSGYLKSMIWPGAAEIPPAAAILPEKLAPGEEAEYRFEVSLPLDMKITGCRFEGEKVLPMPPETEFSAWHWDRAVWSVKGKFRILEAGKLPAAKINFTAENRLLKGEKEFSVDIPALTIENIPENRRGEKLLLAPGAGENGADTGTKRTFYRNWKFWTVLAAMVVLLSVAVWFLRRRRAAILAALPLDEKTIREIRELNDLVRSGKMRIAVGVAGLSDIIRDYLEKRFAIPVTRRTTDEFIRDLARADMLLPRSEKIFLTGFMNSADLIKFAGREAGSEMVDNAANQAVELVRVTTIHEEKKS